MKKRVFSLLLALLLLCSFFCVAEARGIAILEVSKYGNLTLGISGEDFFELGFDYGDVISVEISGSSWIMPVCSNYSDVDAGNAACRVKSMEVPVVLAINMGNLAEAAAVDAENPGSVSVAMQEVGAYREQWLIRQLVRTNERADYVHLDDAAFANFRAVDTAGMGKGVIYRSSSPVNPELGRNTYAVDAMRAAGIRTVINLADDVINYEGLQDSYYASCDIICLGLGIDASADEFRHGLAEGLRFLIENEGPYLIHCKEGKDRAGFVSALLECLMGAEIEDVISDYMETYYNYYGTQPGTEQYDAIVSTNISAILESAFGVEDVFACDLAAEAREYLLESGLSPEEIDKLMAKCAGQASALDM